MKHALLPNAICALPISSPRPLGSHFHGVLTTSAIFSNLCGAQVKKQFPKLFDPVEVEAAPTPKYSRTSVLTDPPTAGDGA